MLAGFGALLGFELLDMFMPFVVRVSLVLQSRTNEPVRLISFRGRRRGISALAILCARVCKRFVEHVRSQLNPPKTADEMPKFPNV